MQTIQANIVDVVARRIFFGELSFEEGKICDIQETGVEQANTPYLMPGFVDAHVHIESSMLMPDEFAFAAMEKGTLASVSDPHEIANVLGIQGIELMQRRATLTPFKILFGAPSCVPATPFETAGASITLNDIDQLLKSRQAGYLSEMMNFPGVLNGDQEVMAKLATAQQYQVPVDGHAPGLTDQAAATYAQAGISTDHECTTLKEAEDKIAAGMHILIRDGSAAADFDTLHPLISQHPKQVMLCSDDKHPDDLLDGHIRELVIRALRFGHPLFDVLQAAIINPIQHYQLTLGLLQKGDAMDALLVDSLHTFTIQQAWLDGQRVVENEQCLLPHHPPECLNHFNAEALTPVQLTLPHPGQQCRVIEARDGSLFTRQGIYTMPESDGLICADIEQDILFLAVLNRYQVSPPAVALIKGFGLKEGAMASSVAHDSHNIVAVGTSADYLAKAINAVIAHQGGLSACYGQECEVIPLPVAGLMSDQPATVTGPAYRALNTSVRNMGSQLHAPFMTLSFMALLVIPELKLSDKGLFDGRTFSFCSLGVEPEVLS